MQKNILRLLIIRPGAIGDTLVVLPILQHLRTLSAQTHITFIGNAAVLPLLQAFRLADEVENYEDLFWSRLFMPLADHPQPQLSARLQHIERAICWLTDTDNLVKHNLQGAGIPSVTIAPGRPTASIPIVTYLAQSIGETVEASSWRIPAAYAWQKEQATEQPSRAIAIHPGSGGQKKCWPIAHFATLITELWQHDIPVILLAGPADHERIDTLRNLLPSPPTTAHLQLLQDAPLLTIAQILPHCRSYLGNDAGITHLAALLGVPTLVLFGPSDPIIWKPIGPAVTVLKAPLLDMLAPQTVYKQLIIRSGQKSG